MDVKQAGSEVAGGSWAASGVSALERGLKVLEVMGSAARPLSLADLARGTGFHKSTLLRVLASLERCHYAVRLADGRYRLGGMLLRLGQAYSNSFDLRAALEPVLGRLAAGTREAASFFVREGDGRLCFARVEGRQEVRDFVAVGSVLPLQGAAGHVLQLFAAGPRHDIPWVQASFGERTPEVAAISVPVFKQGQALCGALTLSGTVARFRDQAHSEEMGRILLQEAAALSRELDGGH